MNLCTNRQKEIFAIFPEMDFSPYINTGFLVLKESNFFASYTMKICFKQLVGALEQYGKWHNCIRN